MEFKKIRAASRKEHRERLQRDLQAVKDLTTVAESVLEQCNIKLI